MTDLTADDEPFADAHEELETWGHRDLVDMIIDLRLDRDRWRREFEAAAKFVEENARLWAEVRRLERELAGVETGVRDRRGPL